MQLQTEGVAPSLEQTLLVVLFNTIRWSEKDAVLSEKSATLHIFVKCL